jgi:hypothetical protein
MIGFPPSGDAAMKPIPLMMIVATLAALPACTEKQSTSDKIKDSVNDALDRRPAESIRDAAEDMKDAAADAADSAKQVAEDAKQAAQDAAQTAKDAAADAKAAAIEARDKAREEIRDAAK